MEAGLVGPPPGAMSFRPRGDLRLPRRELLTAHALVALPGAVGTSNELEMAAELGPASGPARADRRTILIGPREEFPAAALAAFLHAASLEEARRHLTRMLRPSFVAMGGAPA